MLKIGMETELGTWIKKLKFSSSYEGEEVGL